MRREFERAVVKVSRIMDALEQAERAALALLTWTLYGTNTAAAETNAVVAKSCHRVRQKPTTALVTDAVTAAANGSDPAPSSFLSSSPVVPKDYPEELQEIRVFLHKISAPAVFDDPAYWVAIHGWLGDSRVGYLDELAKYLAWWIVQSGTRKHRDLQRGFRNWLAKSEYWAEQQAQRQAVRRGR